GERFGTTLVVANEPASEGVVAAIGFYGDRLRIGYGSLGGWDPFGPERLITRARGNVLFELDGQCALELYRTYLGSHADELPAAALRFPLMLRGKPGEPGLVRTILGIDDVAGSMRFAGEMPEGGYARLMKANFERLIDGAQGAAERSLAQLDAPGAELALLISCVGRKLVLRQRVDEEIDSVREVVGPTATLAGFYSYGEICPVAPDAGCELHNQTMTITTFREI
ncbi:MAG TPA: FIST C-terminal domain-containing protein, partial [Nannocystaceae bacterium]|nr:FIST C-terminal domain-containing protein [Nannocystaceae bacterium]